MRHHVRYNMTWGHTISARGETVEVTRAEYNLNYGAPVPEQPDIPECGWEMWKTWWRLNARRPSGESQTPLSWGEMQAFCKMTGSILTPQDVQMLESIDNAYLISVSEERRAAFERSREENQKPKKAAK